MTKRKALVTGATGYVGLNLCQLLLKDGWEVNYLVRSMSHPLPTNLSVRMTKYVYDGSTESALTAITESQPDIVFHLASMFIAEHTSEQISGLIASNVLYGTQLVEACVRGGVRYFINTSTSWQHYRSDDYDPVCLYAATKQAFEDILDFYTDAYPLSAVTLKLFDTYGPDDPRPKLMNLLMETALTGKALGISPGDQVLDLVHIDDVSKAFVSCAYYLFDCRKSLAHERYAVSSGAFISVKQLVSLLEKIRGGGPLNVTFGARPYRQREVMIPWRAQHHVPKWKATIDLESGLATLLQA